jgi:hypothetical protein
MTKGGYGCTRTRISSKGGSCQLRWRSSLPPRFAAAPWPLSWSNNGWLLRLAFFAMLQSLTSAACPVYFSRSAYSFRIADCAPSLAFRNPSVFNLKPTRQISYVPLPGQPNPNSMLRQSNKQKNALSLCQAEVYVDICYSTVKCTVFLSGWYFNWRNEAWVHVN